MEEQKERTHFIGIGGSGMSGLAKILLELGQPVSGSDVQLTSTTDKLQALGAKIYAGHSKENIGPDVKLVVRSTAISPNNPEILRAQELHIPIIHRGELLAQLTERKKAIAVAGAHGKTTTTSMLACVLSRGGLDPTIVVGGELQDIGGNAKYGRGQYLIAEADESDGSFLKLHPHVAVVTNIEDDHLDHYGSVENIIKAFEKFINLVPEDSFCVLCADDPELDRMSRHRKNVFTYGLTGSPDYKAVDLILEGAVSQAQIYFKEQFLGTLELTVPGQHNISNALAAIAVAHQLGLNFQVMAEALKNFRGAGRRFQTVGNFNGIRIIDDYAHHPTEIRATLSAAKQLKPKRLWAVFQPHRYSRTRQLYKEFGKSFRDADQVIVNSIYAASEQPIPGITAELIAEEIKKNGTAVQYMAAKEEIVQYLARECTSGDLVLTIGAGNIWTVGPELLAKLSGECGS